jgi:hypothetical protein
MDNPHSTAARELSKLISALRKQWLEELGGPEAARTEAVLKNAHRLLAEVNAGNPPQPPSHAALETELGAAWLAVNPWARPHVQRLAAVLTVPAPAG